MGERLTTPDRFSLRVPARADLIGTLRVFVSTIARHVGLDDDAIEDVKLAVSEACADPVEAGVDGPVELVIAADAAGLRVEIASRVWAEGPAAPELPEGIDARTFDRVELVRALFADAERSDEDGIRVVRFSTGSRASETPDS